MINPKQEKAWLFFQSLQRWHAKSLLGDISAGVSVAAIAIPAQMATAHLAGFPAIAGIYAFVAAAIGFAILGGNRYMSCGADSTIAPIFASSLSLYAVAGTENYVQLAGLLSVLVGLVLLTTYIFRLGWLASLLSYPVIVGFLAGISCHIIIGQLPSILGLDASSRHLLELLWRLIVALPQANIPSALIGVCVFVFTAFFAKKAPRFPAALMALVISMLATWLGHLSDHGVATLSDIHAELPGVVLWSLPWHQVIHLFPLALLIATVCMMQTAAISSTTLDHRASVDKDFAGIGLGCIFAGMWGAFATNSSPARTVITKNAGGTTQLSAVFAALLLLAVALWGGNVLHWIPHAALAGVLVYVGLSIFKLSEIKRIFTQSRTEFYLCMATFFMILVFRIETGVMLGVVLSLLHGVYMIARPNCDEFMRVKGSSHWGHNSHKLDMEELEKVVVLHFSAPLYFTNVDFFCNKICSIKESRPEISLIIIECSGIIDLDLTAADKVKRLNHQLEKQEVKMVFVCVESPRTKSMAKSTQLFQAIKQESGFYSVQHAIDSLLPAQSQAIRDYRVSVDSSL